MRKNTIATFRAWKNGQSKKVATSIHTDGQTIYSYSTAILRHGAGTLPVLNSIKYSSTTTRQQNDLRSLMSENGLQWTEQEGI